MSGSSKEADIKPSNKKWLSSTQNRSPCWKMSSMFLHCSFLCSRWDPFWGRELSWILQRTPVALGYCCRYWCYITVNVGRIKLGVDPTNWFWRFYFTDLNFMECSITHIHGYLIGTFEVVRDEEVSFSSVSRYRNSSWGNGRYTSGTVNSVRTMCFSGSISPHWMWFQSLMRQCIFL